MKEIFGEVVNISQLDNGSYILDMSTVTDTSETGIIPEKYFDKVCSKWLTEGSLVRYKAEERVIGKTTWKDDQGNEIVHGKNLDGSWKMGMEEREGERQMSFAGINKISVRLFEKKEKELRKTAARQAVKQSYDTDGDAALAKVLADIELA